MIFHLTWETKALKQIQKWRLEEMGREHQVLDRKMAKTNRLNKLKPEMLISKEVSFKEAK